MPSEYKDRKIAEELHVSESTIAGLRFAEFIQLKNSGELKTKDDGALESPSAFDVEDDFFIGDDSLNHQ